MLDGHLQLESDADRSEADSGAFPAGCDRQHLVASGAAPRAWALPYATAKAAIEGLTRSIAVDYGRKGIRTNAVALGSISTERYESYRQAHPEVDAQMALLHPLGRVGTREEVAEAVAFLLSPAAGFINGVTLPVDGGRAINGVDPEAD